MWRLSGSRPRALPLPSLPPLLGWAWGSLGTSPLHPNFAPLLLLDPAFMVGGSQGGGAAMGAFSNFFFYYRTESPKNQGGHQGPQGQHP